MIMLKLTENFEITINVVLLSMLALVVLLATVDLGWIILKDILTPTMLLLNDDELLELFGIFPSVMIGLELLDTVKSYITQKSDPRRSGAVSGDHRHRPKGRDPRAERDGCPEAERHRRNHRLAHGRLLLREACSSGWTATA